LSNLLGLSPWIVVNNPLARESDEIESMPSSWEIQELQLSTPCWEFAGQLLGLSKSRAEKAQ
jgi:hypothetical protein